MREAGRAASCRRRCATSGPSMTYLELQAGNTGDDRLRLRGGDGVPGAGGAVRELVAAAGGHPGGADVPAERRSSASASPSTDINIFTQIGFVVLVGLASKNAILIVEFAKQQRDAGRGRREATLEACQLRLRPILMTSFAFILGVRAADARARGRGRDAAGAGHGGLQRHARRDAVRHLPDAGVLLRDRLAGREHAVPLAPWSGARLPGSPSGCSRSAPSASWCAGWPPAAPPAASHPAPGPRSPNRCPSRCTSRSAGPSSIRERDRCSRSSSSTGRSSPRCCRSSSRWPAASRVFTLPVAQYPEITPPTVEVSAIYPGANAKVVADTVAAPIEQQVNGVEDMLYMSSQCTNDGTLHADRHVQARHRPEHGPGAGAEPRRPGRSRCCPTWSSAAASRSRRSRPAC